MAKTLKEAPITTANARRKLKPGEYARRLDNVDAAIWYRNKSGSGSWFVRWRNRGPGANYKQETIGPANDVNDKPVDGFFTFSEAAAKAKEIAEGAIKLAKAEASGPPMTVRSAVESYVAERDARESARKGRAVRSDAGQRLGRYVLGQDARGKREAIPEAPLAAVKLYALSKSDLEAWRGSLPETMKASSKQRLINDLKAALNAAIDGADPHQIDPTLPMIIKDGLKAKKMQAGTAAEPKARDNQILADGEILRLIAAAQEIDSEQGWECDLYRLVLVLAATGARFSQVARMTVADVQPERSRLMIPVSRKGNGDKAKTHTRKRVGDDIIDALLPATIGRPMDAPLLERWRHTQKLGAVGQWERSERAAWTAPSELSRPWQDIRKRAGLPNCIPYALRHSSIVRQLRENLPVSFVADVHDTSAAMIEAHYGRWISDDMEELSARAIVPLVPVAAQGENVVKLRSAQ